MYINCHTHVFNAKSVFTKYTFQILLNRLGDANLDPVIQELLANQLGKVLSDEKICIDEQGFYRKIVGKLYETDRFQELLGTLSAAEKKELKIVEIDALTNLAADRLADILSRVSERLLHGSEEEDARNKTAADFFAFLQICFQPSIRKVTERLMKQLPGPNRDAVVALMMDITDRGEEPGQFADQIQETAEMVLAYPGRFFPFIAVNPRRPGYFRTMKRALNGQGFIGIKLYPSLGYEIDSIEMGRLYSYCMEEKIPIVMHCTKFGFRYDASYADHSSPKKWRAILRRYRDLKVCFGHFGSEEFMCGLPEPPGVMDPDPWTPVILELMDKYPNVYADISYHTLPMNGTMEVTTSTGTTQTVPVEANYFRAMEEYLAHDVYRKRILWGSDYYMVRQRLRENSQWAYFRNHLSESQFNQIAVENPRTFLNLPGDNSDLSLPGYIPDAILENYIDCIVRNRHRVEQNRVPKWLKGLIAVRYGDSVHFNGTPLGDRWSYNHQIHRALYEALLAMNEFMGTPKFPEAGALKLGELHYSRELSFLTSAKLKRQCLDAVSNLLIQEFLNRAFLPGKKNGKPVTRSAQKRTIIKALSSPMSLVADLGSTLDPLFTI